MSRGDGHDNVPIDNPEGAILNFLEFRYWTITIAKEDTVTVEANRLNHMEWAIWGLMGHRIRDSNFTSFIAFLCVLSLCSMWFKNLSIFTPRYSYDSSSFTATLLNTMFEFRALYNFFDVPNKTYSVFSCLRFMTSLYLPNQFARFERSNLEYDRIWLPDNKQRNPGENISCWRR